MSFNGGNLTEADHIPGAFPSEEAVLATEQNSHNSQTTPVTENKATATGGNVDEKKREFLEQQEAAHTAGGRETDKYTPGSERTENRPESLSSQDNKTLSQEPSRAGLEPSTSSAQHAETPSAGQQSLNTHKTASHDESSIGSNLATVATALGLAAKDALFAAKDSAVPAASAATEQVSQKTNT